MTVARMADSVEPQLIPALYRMRPNGVAAYIDGERAWPRHQLERFPRMWRITVTGSAEAVPHARVIDCETGDATADDVVRYESERAALGETTIAYCSRSTVPLIRDAGNNWPNLHWWIATLDRYPWTAQLLTQWIMETYGVALEPAKIRACQNFPMGSYDESTLFGNPGWARG